jgi:hypothetical protein
MSKVAVTWGPSGINRLTCAFLSFNLSFNIAVVTTHSMGKYPHLCINSQFIGKKSAHRLRFAPELLFMIFA